MTPPSGSSEGRVDSVPSIGLLAKAADDVPGLALGGRKHPDSANSEGVSAVVATDDSKAAQKKQWQKQKKPAARFLELPLPDAAPVPTTPPEFSPGGTCRCMVREEEEEERQQLLEEELRSPVAPLVRDERERQRRGTMTGGGGQPQEAGKGGERREEREEDVRKKRRSAPVPPPPPRSDWFTDMIQKSMLTLKPHA